MSLDIGYSLLDIGCLSDYTANMDLGAYLEERRQLVDAELDARMPGAEVRPFRLHEAMRYSVLSGGKRLRPIMCLAAAEAVGGSCSVALVPAVALEVLHTYTLIHDDLPCMDDDDVRRGQPSVHKAYDGATAVLAGDALLTLAFEWLGQCEQSGLVTELATAAGSTGVIGGQAEDIAATGGELDAEQLAYIHRHKTGKLITAAVRMGAIAGHANASQLAALTQYGEDVGLAFQIADDLLNATSTAEELGKPVGSDDASGKVTYVAVHGIDAARTRAGELAESAAECLTDLGAGAKPLAALASYAVERTR